MDDEIPPWLESLLSTRFFSACPTHRDAARSECNLYCLDCQNGAFCFYCRSLEHEDHNVIQIRRSSYHDVVRVGEIHKVLNISGVQSYVINSAKVIFLNERPQQLRNGKGIATSLLCETCGRSLLDPFRFCSLGCKVARIKKKDMERTTTRKFLSEEESQEEQEMNESNMPRSSLPSIPSNPRRSRKGIPRRSPFGCYNI